MSVRAQILPELDSIAFGGDYNPEQWDEAAFVEDLALMKEMGVNLVSLAIFAWGKLEPAEGVYDFDWLETIIDELYANGVHVDLATGTASPPAWMASTHPQIMPVTWEGVRLGFGSRQHTCLSDPYLRDKQAQLAGALAKRFASHPGVIMWHVNNEYSCHTWECFCDTCVHEFRAWLRERYHDLSTLNQVWGTAFWSQTYTDWAQVPAPAAMPTLHNPSHILDWRRFCDQQMQGMFLNEYQAIRSHSEAPITTNFMGAHPRLDYRAWAELVDIVANDAYPDPADPAAAWESAWQGDLERGLAKGAWMLMEQASSAVQWRRRNSPKRPGQFELWSLSSIARGAEAILQFQWRQSAAGSETFHSGMVPHAGRYSRTFGEVSSFGKSLPSLASVRGQHSVSPVAIVVDWPSQWALESVHGPVAPSEPFEQARQWHRTFWEDNIATDIVGVDADFSAYSIIVVPGVFIDYPQMAAALEEAGERGAHIIVTGQTAVVDEHGHALLGGYGGSLRSLLGVHVTDHHALTGPVRTEDERTELASGITRKITVPAAHTWCGMRAIASPLMRALDAMASPTPHMRGGMWAEEISLYRPSEAPRVEFAYPDFWPALSADVDIMAVFDGSGGGADLAAKASVTRRRVASGSAWYIAANLDALSRSAVARVVCAYGRVRPTVSGLPDGVEAVRRGDTLFLLNHSDRAVELSGIVGVELRTGSECRGHVVVAPRSAAVVRTVA